MSVLVANHSYFLTLCPPPVTSLHLSFWHVVFCCFSPFPLSLSLNLSLLISLALHLSHHHSLLFSLSVGDGVKCSCRPNSPVIGSHLLLPPQCIWNHWLQTSQSKSKPGYKGNAFKGKGVCAGFRFMCNLAVCVCMLSPTRMYHIVSESLHIYCTSTCLNKQPVNQIDKLSDRYGPLDYGNNHNHDYFISVNTEITII